MKTDERFIELEKLLKPYKSKINFDDIRQDAFLALLDGKSVREAIRYAIRKDNTFWCEKKKENPHIYDDHGNCRDEEVYFRTDREDGETGHFIGDHEKEMTAKIHYGVSMLRTMYDWTARNDRKSPYTDYCVLNRFVRSTLNFFNNVHFSRMCRKSFYIKKGNKL